MTQTHENGNAVMAGHAPMARSGPVAPPDRFYTVPRGMAGEDGAASHVAVGSRDGATSEPRRYGGREVPTGSTAVRGVAGREHSYAMGSPDGSGSSDRAQVALFSAVSGGMGLSTLVASVAWHADRQEVRCVLVDADFQAGGLDVLLGLEHDQGMRFGEVQAPLGRLDGDALHRDMVRWGGLGVLPFDSWKADVPDWWVAQAAVRGLEECVDVVLVDCGCGGEVLRQAELRADVHVVAVELSVLGVARAQVYCERLERRASVSDGEGGNGGSAPIALVGMMPRGAPHDVGAVDWEEAESYVGHPMVGVMRHDRKLCADIRSGLGVRRVSRGNRAVVQTIAEVIERPALVRGGRRRARRGGVGGRHSAAQHGAARRGRRG